MHRTDFSTRRRRIRKAEDDEVVVSKQAKGTNDRKCSRLENETWVRADLFWPEAAVPACRLSGRQVTQSQNQ